MIASRGPLLRLLALAGTGLLAVAAAVGFRQYQTTAGRSPSDPAVTMARTLLHASESDPSIRLRTLQSGVDAAAPSDTASRWALADFFRQQNQLDQAVEQLQAIAKREPHSPEAPLVVAGLFLQSKQFARAESAYRHLTERWPRNADSWQGLAGALYYERRYLESVQAARKAVTLQPEEPKHQAALATALMEHALQVPKSRAYFNELSEARKIFEKVREDWPQKGEVYYRLGRACYVLSDKGPAVSNLRRAAELLPERADVTYLLARAYSRAGDDATARKVLEAAVIRHPGDAPLHDLLGQTLQASSDPDSNQRALEEFREGVRLAPDVGLVQERFGAACLRANRLEEARTAFENAIRLNPHRSFPYQQLALIYNRLRDRKRAAEYAKLATQIVFNEQQLARIQRMSGIDPQSVVLRLILADRYREIGLRRQSRDEYLAALSLDPKNQRAKSGLAAVAKAGPDRPEQPAE